MSASPWHIPALDLAWSQTAGSHSMGLALPMLVDLLRVRVAVEIGIRFGFTTEALAKALSLCHGKRGLLISCDIDPESCAKADAVTAGLSVRFKSILADSRTVAWTDILTAYGEKRIDLAYADGSHEEPFVYADISGLVPLLRPLGAIVVHDYFPGRPDVMRAVAHFLSDHHGEWNMMVLPEIAGRNSSVASCILQKRGEGEMACTVLAD